MGWVGSGYTKWTNGQLWLIANRQTDRQTDRATRLLSLAMRSNGTILCCSAADSDDVSGSDDRCQATGALRSPWRRRGASRGHVYLVVGSRDRARPNHDAAAADSDHRPDIGGLPRRAEATPVQLPRRIGKC